jgi:hypothetical protein
MKSAYELAMERLNKQSPAAKLNAEQKKQLAELDSVYAAKIAEREIHFKGRMAEAAGAGDFAAHEEAQAQLVAERKKQQADLEEKKQRVRDGQA